MEQDHDVQADDLAQLADDARRLTSERDAAICRARTAGGSLRRIATAARMTPRAIAHICKRDTST